MAKKKVSADNVDDMLDGNGAETPAEKPAKVKKAAAPAAKPAAKAKPAKAAAPAAKPAKAAPKKGKVAAEVSESRSEERNEVRKALLKVRKAISYADFAENNGFSVRIVRRTARKMRDNGEIQISKEGTTGFVSAAV